MKYFDLPMRILIVTGQTVRAKSEANDSLPPGKEFSTGKRYLLKNTIY